MRIAVYHNLPSGGAKRALWEMVRRLGVAHQLDVYTLSSAEHDFCDLRPHCIQHMVFPFWPLPLARRPLGRLNQGIRSLDLLRLGALQRRIAAQIDASGYDVVFAHHCRFGQAPALLRFLAAPSAYYCHEPPREIYEPPVARPYTRYSTLQRAGNLLDPFPALYRTLLRRLDRQSLQAASVVLANSAFSRESLYRAYGVFARVCRLGVDGRRFKPVGEARQEYVLSVGAIHPLKGVDFLLHSLAYLDPECRPMLLVVCNVVDARERRYLEDIAQRLGVHLEFRLLVDDGELVRCYQQARLTLCASIMEPFGLVPLESLACGTAVVGVREGGLRESIVDGVVGRLVDRDPVDFAGAVQALLDDPALAERFGKQGRTWVEENWTWEQSVAQMERYLEVATVVDR